MNGGQKTVETPAARSVQTQKIAGSCKNHGLIQDHPTPHFTPELADAQLHVITKPADDIAVGPATPFLQCLRQVPVIERYPGLNTFCQALINQPVVKINAGIVDMTGCAIRKNAAP